MVIVKIAVVIMRILCNDERDDVLIIIWNELADLNIL